MLKLARVDRTKVVAATEEVQVDADLGRTEVVSVDRGQEVAADSIRVTEVVSGAVQAAVMEEPDKTAASEADATISAHRATEVAAEALALVKEAVVSEVVVVEEVDLVAAEMPVADQAMADSEVEAQEAVSKHFCLENKCFANFLLF